MFDTVPIGRGRPMSRVRAYVYRFSASPPAPSYIVIIAHVRDFINSCRAHCAAYALSRSAAINGLDDDTVIIEIMPLWRIITVVGTRVIGGARLFRGQPSRDHRFRGGLLPEHRDVR